MVINNSLMLELKKVPIINILIKNSYPLKGGYPRISTIAKWRGGKKYNVSIYLETNTFYDFVTGDFGDSLDLLSLILNKEKESINLIEFIESYSNIQVDKSIEQMTQVNNEDYETEEFILEDIKNIIKFSRDLYNDHYFYKKNINDIDKLELKQLKLSNFILNKSLVNKFFYKKLDKFEKMLLRLNDSIIIPIFNIKTLLIQSIQYLLPENNLFGNKYFHSGGKIKYGFFPIGIKNLDTIDSYNKFIVCEGVATGLSIQKIINNKQIPILCALTAQNISLITDFLLENNKQVVIASDFDQLNINNNIFQLGASFKVIKKYNNNQNVIITIANNLHDSDSKYYLDYLLSENLSENLNFSNDISDFNDIINKNNLIIAKEVFDNNLNYYCKIFNKHNFLNKIKDVNINYSPFSYYFNNENNQLNNIILENSFIFYNEG